MIKGIRSDGTQSYTVDAQSYTENGVFFSIFSVNLRGFSANLCVTERLRLKWTRFALIINLHHTHHPSFTNHNHHHQAYEPPN
jgi:hypothetical protein